MALIVCGKKLPSRRRGGQERGQTAGETLGGENQKTANCQIEQWPRFTQRTRRCGNVYYLFVVPGFKPSDVRGNIGKKVFTHK